MPVVESQLVRLLPMVVVMPVFLPSPTINAPTPLASFFNAAVSLSASSSSLPSLGSVGQVAADGGRDAGFFTIANNQCTYAAGIFFQCSGEFVGIQLQFAIAGIGRDTNLRQRFIVGRTNGITQHRLQLRLNRPQRGVAEQCAIARTLAISSRIYGGVFGQAAEGIY